MISLTKERLYLYIALLGLFCPACRPAPPPATSPSLNAPIVSVNVPFEEVAQRAGIDFKFENGHKGMATMMEENGSGCAFLDYNGDGLLDVYLLNGRDLYGRGLKSRNALYRNNGDGTFTDVTEQAGVPGTGYGLGVAVADYDNDGKPDIYISQWGKNALYHNNGNGTFADVAEKTGLGAMDFGEPFHTGAVWLDYDHDGRLDLFVCTYVKYRIDGLRYCKLANDITSNCPPSAYSGTASLLFHQNRDGTFTNVTKQTGVYIPTGKALSAITCDVDDDGWTDIFVGNDGVENWLFRNNKNGTFTNVASAAGVAFAQTDGASIASMGIDFGDYRNEGIPGLFVADWSKRPDHLWKGQKGGFYTEVSAPSGIGDAGFPYLGFGAGFIDYDNDGWLDIFLANGHVYPEVEQSTTDERYLQPNQLFHNERNGKFHEATREADAPFALLHTARGVAFGDYDNDGKVDILVSNNDGTPLLLHNTAANRNHFVTLQLVGVKSNRDGIGARVWLKAGSTTLLQDRKSGGSYLSSSDPRLHFGLGDRAEFNEIEVRWTSGLRQILKGRWASNQLYELREGDNKLRPTTFPTMRKGTP